MSDILPIRFFVDEGQYDWDQIDSTKGQFRYEPEGWSDSYNSDPSRLCPYSDPYPTLDEAVKDAIEWFKDEIDVQEGDVITFKLPDGTTRDINLKD